MVPKKFSIKLFFVIFLLTFIIKRNACYSIKLFFIGNTVIHTMYQILKHIVSNVLIKVMIPFKILIVKSTKNNSYYKTLELFITFKILKMTSSSGYLV